MTGSAMHPTPATGGQGFFTRKRVVLLGGLAAAVVLFFVFRLDRHLSWQSLQENKAELKARVEQAPLMSAAVYFVAYVAVTGLSLPGATVMTLAGGFLFQRLLGVVLVSIASTAGATLAFLSSRYLFHDLVQRRFGQRLGAIHRGLETDGAYYLLTLRLVPLFPFFVVNLLMGLTRMRVWTYWWVSQLGMLPATVIYVNAGTALSEVQSPADVLSPGLLASLAALGVFPLLIKKGVQWQRGRSSRAVRP
jgi:uncharacterized membrane protein YdjX (TVP38/TMEM64 family)